MASEQNHPPNESTTLILKGRGPRRGAHDPGSPGEPGAFHLFGLGTVTPATSPVTQTNHPTPTEPQQRYKQDVGARSIVRQCTGSWFPVHGPAQDGAVTPGQF